MNPLLPIADPLHDGTAWALSAGLILFVVTCSVRLKVEPSGSVKLNGWPPACASASL